MENQSERNDKDRKYKLKENAELEQKEIKKTAKYRLEDNGKIQLKE